MIAIEGRSIAEAIDNARRQLAGSEAALAKARRDSARRFLAGNGALKHPAVRDLGREVEDLRATLDGLLELAVLDEYREVVARIKRVESDLSRQRLEIRAASEPGGSRAFDPRSGEKLTALWGHVVRGETELKNLQIRERALLDEHASLIDVAGGE